MSKAGVMVRVRPQDAIRYLQEDHVCPCEHGHYDCSSMVSGACSDEVFALLRGKGLVDNEGDPVIVVEDDRGD